MSPKPDPLHASSKVVCTAIVGIARIRTETRVSAGLLGTCAIWDSDISADGREVAWCTHSGCVHTLPVHTVSMDPRKRPPATFRGQRNEVPHTNRFLEMMLT